MRRAAGVRRRFPDLENEFHSLVTELLTSLNDHTTDPVSGELTDVVIDGYRLANLVLTQIEQGRSPTSLMLVHALAQVTVLRLPQRSVGEARGVSLGWGLDFGVLCREHALYTDLEQVAANAKQALPTSLTLSSPECASPHAHRGLRESGRSGRPRVGRHASRERRAGPAACWRPRSFHSAGLGVVGSGRADEIELVGVRGAGDDVMIWEPACATQLMHDFLDGARC